MREWISTSQENRLEMLEMTEFERAVSVEERWHFAIAPSNWPLAALADSPVKRCMLCSRRLGCLKKPTEEARGG
jgi:hypothetical protein